MAILVAVVLTVIHTIGKIVRDGSYVGASYCPRFDLSALPRLVPPSAMPSLESASLTMPRAFEADERIDGKSLLPTNPALCLPLPLGHPYIVRRKGDCCGN